jgi:hypothetical protein
MQSLEKRIAALEQANPEAGFPDTIFILFLQPGETEREIHKLCNTPSGADRLEWLRGPNESEQEFKDRASKEVPRNAGGIGMLFMCE